MGPEDPKEDIDERSSIAEVFFHANECCLDEGVGIPLQQLMTRTSEALDDGPLRHFAFSLFNHAKSQTIPVEERFKRVRTNSASNAGACHYASTVASNHVLREWKTMHAASSRPAPSRRPATRGGASSSRSTRKDHWLKSKKKLSVHNLIMSDTFANTPRLPGQSQGSRLAIVHDLVREIKRDPAATQRFSNKTALANGRRKRLLAQQRAAAEPPSAKTPEAFCQRTTPWGIGSERFPVSEQHLTGFMQQHQHVGKNPVDFGHDAWCSEHNDAVSDNNNADHDVGLASRPRRLTCGELYGIGFCKLSFSEARLTKMQQHRSVLDSIAHQQKAETIFGGGYIFRLVATSAAGDELRDQVLRSVVSIFNPELQVFVRC